MPETRPWKVLASYEVDGLYCVDVFEHPDTTFGFEYFRRDVEDGGNWTLIGGYSEAHFASAVTALEAACEAVPWLRASLPDAQP